MSRTTFKKSQNYFQGIVNGILMLNQLEWMWSLIAGNILSVAFLHY